MDEPKETSTVSYEERCFWKSVHGERFGRYRDLMNTADDAVEKAANDADKALDGLRRRAPWLKR